MGNNHKYDNRIIFHPDGVQMKFLKEAAEFAGCNVEMVLKVIVTSWLCQYQLLKPGKDRKTRIRSQNGSQTEITNPVKLDFQGRKDQNRRRFIPGVS